MTFPKDISLKVNLIAKLEFELAYYDVTIQCVNYYTMDYFLRSSKSETEPIKGTNIIKQIQPIFTVWFRWFKYLVYLVSIL